MQALMGSSRVSGGVVRFIRHGCEEMEGRAHTVSRGGTTTKVCDSLARPLLQVYVRALERRVCFRIALCPAAWWVDGHGGS